MSEEYDKGFQEGYNACVKISRQNRDHFRQLIRDSLPFETHEEAIHRIYKNPRKNSTITEIMADGVDLYVMVPTVFTEPTTNGDSDA